MASSTGLVKLLKVRNIQPEHRTSSLLLMHLSSSSPRGGGETPGCRWGNWGLCGDFAAYLCPRGGGNEGPLSTS